MRVALAQINPTVGDVAGNVRLILAHADRARGADLVVFPELSVSGYPPRDLLHRQGFVAACEAAIRDLAERLPVACVVGAPMPAPPTSTGGTRVTNSAVLMIPGQPVVRYDKRLLPTYDVFDEDRHFVPGTRPVAADVPTSGGSARIALAICEDLWKGQDAGFADRYAHRADPVAEAVGLGARVLVAPSASPFVLGKDDRHDRILRDHARSHGVHVVSVNQVGGNDDLIFAGGSGVFAPDGSVVGRAARFREDLAIVDLSHPSPTPSEGREDDRELFGALTFGIRDYLSKTGFARAIVGVSGGIDSALTACLAAHALGPANVTAIAMPSKYSSGHSVEDARTLARNLGVELWTIPIHGPVRSLGESLDAAFISHALAPLGRTVPDLTEENLQSRVRGTILMGVSNRTGAMVLTTGNKSELAVGYCTLYGDMNGGLGVLSDVPKTRVYSVSRWINAHARELGWSGPPIPESSITKAPSAELRPDQTDQDTLPPYDLLDAIIEEFVVKGGDAASIARSLGADAALVRRVCAMIDRAEYKRRQAATGLKVTSVAFGPGRRFPIAQRWEG